MARFSSSSLIALAVLATACVQTEDGAVLVGDPAPHPDDEESSGSGGTGPTSPDPLCPEDGGQLDEAQIVLAPESPDIWTGLVGATKCTAMVHDDYDDVANGERHLQFRLQDIQGRWQDVEGYGQRAVLSESGRVGAVETLEGDTWAWWSFSIGDDGVATVGDPLPVSAWDTLVSADWSRFATGGYYQQTSIVDVATGQVTEVPGLTDDVSADLQGLDQDGGRLLIATASALVEEDTDSETDCYFVDTATGAASLLTGGLASEDGIYGCRTGARGDRVVIEAAYFASNGSYQDRLYTVQDGVTTLHVDGEAGNAAISPDGDVVFYSTRSGPQALHVPTGQTLSWDDELTALGVALSYTPEPILVDGAAYFMGSQYDTDDTFTGLAVVQVPLVF